MRKSNTIFWLVAYKALGATQIVDSFYFPAVSVAATRPTFCRTAAIFLSQVHDSIEPYIGPVGSFADMEGGVTIENLHLNVLAGPSLVAQGRGLFLCIYNEVDLEATDEEEGESVEEIIIPQGTPLCGYSRGYFSDEEKGDKSVVFRFKEQSFHDTAVFYNQRLTSIVDAIWDTFDENSKWKGGRINPKEDEILFGHIVQIDHGSQQMKIRADERFFSRIFIPETLNEDVQFSATYLGVYANDLAFDPHSSQEEYLENSEKNNILQLVWRLAADEKSGMLVPTWPVVVAKKDIRLLNTVPMEVGLEYGFQYWDAYTKLGDLK
mmetsp:Transcript_15175/g.28530  ORF Transcript_15175/g.28530 Transcript_15175/m.28530 type:complete len:322 (-) Transcript_15175:506-1471(-)|eukprot:CAMPEP_0176488626 /NCGR_PEP_ID=MMETSP0200_2-20121128/6817_1 /TAXON_ID=947934 /ORGANISM="Chaetoceros sp., Strain GSL56" /LENGTH=321 /DNA_ID=CAMNT_0017885637 /DNA_START=27 /DNA_END=992 /DNA_ORIENTATION=-